jgi:FkbM family methyltransferase
LPLFFDIGANRGDATVVALALGYDVIAVEPSRIYAELVKNFIYDPRVTPIKFAVSDKNNERVEFYEAAEDGLSTLNKDWLTSPDMPYNGKPFWTTYAHTITIDTLAEIYGEPDLIKIDVEGAEWSVFNGMIRKYKMLTFEWTQETIDEHQKQLHYLAALGYTEVAPQFIVHHLEEPTQWYDIDQDLWAWRDTNAKAWETDGWKTAGLRPTADVGMCWVR